MGSQAWKDTLATPLTIGTGACTATIITGRELTLSLKLDAAADPGCVHLLVPASLRNLPFTIK